MEVEEPLEEVPMEKLRKWYEDANNQFQELTQRNLPSYDQRMPCKSKVFCEPLGIEIPKGTLFYPCCGGDTSLAMKLFGDCLDGCIFADPLWLNSRRSSQLKFVERIGHFRMIDGQTRRKYLRRLSNAVRMFNDGLICFLEDVTDLSVFFYRGDSTGEGGSNQL